MVVVDKSALLNHLTVDMNHPQTQSTYYLSEQRTTAYCLCQSSSSGRKEALNTVLETVCLLGYYRRRTLILSSLLPGLRSKDNPPGRLSAW